MSQPLLSVVMAVYNGEAFVRDAIDSILKQTYQNFEFIIINDASTDSTPDILKSYNDPRIVILTNDTNRFLPYSLNRGIDASKGKYIVRMDADDTSMPERLQLQLDYMEGHPEVGIAGTRAYTFGAHKGKITYKPDDVDIKIEMLSNCHMVHPTLIIRKSMLDEHDLRFNPDYRKNQDYKFFIDAIDKTKFGNLTAFLLNYRTTAENLQRKVHNQDSNNARIRQELYAKIGATVTEDETWLFEQITLQEYERSEDFVARSRSLLERLVSANDHSGFYPKAYFANYISTLWMNICRNCTAAGLSIYKHFTQSLLKENVPDYHKTAVIILIKSILKK